jgi:hypothetical protein
MVNRLSSTTALTRIPLPSAEALTLGVTPEPN